MSRRLPGYVDLDRAYQRPDTAKPSQLGWWHQTAANLDQMWYAYDVGDGLESGAVTEPTVPWVGLTSTSVAQRYLYNRVGQIAYVWATSELTTIGSGQAGLTLPYPPATVGARMVVGRGVLRETALSRDYGLVVTLSPNSSVASIWLGDGPLLSASGIGSSTVSVQLSYRVDPVEGLVSGRAYIHDHRGPV